MVLRSLMEEIQSFWGSSSVDYQGASDTELKWWRVRLADSARMARLVLADLEKMHLEDGDGAVRGECFRGDSYERSIKEATAIRDEMQRELQEVGEEIKKREG